MLPHCPPPSSNDHHDRNPVAGRWTGSAHTSTIPDPLNGEAFVQLPDTQADELDPFVASLAACPKSGLHNPLKNPERYVMYGAVSAKVAEEMRRPEVADFFARLIQRTSPKSYAQALAEVVVTRRFFENFSGDQVGAPALPVVRATTLPCSRTVSAPSAAGTHTHTHMHMHNTHNNSTRALHHTTGPLPRAWLQRAW